MFTLTTEHSELLLQQRRKPRPEKNQFQELQGTVQKSHHWSIYLCFILFRYLLTNIHYFNRIYWSSLSHSKLCINILWYFRNLRPLLVHGDNSNTFLVLGHESSWTFHQVHPQSTRHCRCRARQIQSGTYRIKMTLLGQLVQATKKRINN